MPDYAVTKTVDYKGLPCPMPVVKISQDISSVQTGEVIEVLTTDPGSLSDFPAWAQTTGHEIVETKQEAGMIRIFVKRLK
ncbi:MAG: sulfurtransferase TusA family protein [Candidatus Alcyoniella australis]|nr:sulfurtransferase TusA family protein [Candidatus Alcyoniella australis]